MSEPTFREWIGALAPPAIALLILFIILVLFVGS